MEFDLIKRIICETMDIDESAITMDTNLVEDLSADSIELFQIIMGLEEALDIVIDTDACMELTTIRDACELIKNTIGK